MAQNSPLLKLPRELRDRIWHYACHDWALKLRETNPLVFMDNIRLKFNLPLLGVCRQIQEEVQNVADAIYSSNKFSFTNVYYLWHVEQTVGSKYMSAIRKLRIGITPGESTVEQPLDLVKFVVSNRCTGLQLLELHSTETDESPADTHTYYASVERVEHRIPRKPCGSRLRSNSEIQADECIAEEYIKRLRIASWSKDRIQHVDGRVLMSCEGESLLSAVKERFSAR